MGTGLFALVELRKTYDWAVSNTDSVLPLSKGWPSHDLDERIPSSQLRGALEEDGGRRLDIADVFEDPLLKAPYNEDPNRWMVVFHCIGIMYMLLGLNTVCDVFFTGALEQMVETWDIKPDVAGATFMAAGGSAPELFTSIVGTCVAENEVGFATIVGSAVFNVLFVIGLCSLVAPSDIKLTWWPLARDCSYYVAGLALLAIFAADQVITLVEALVLFAAYLLYCTIMYYNPVLEGKAMTAFDRLKAKKKVAPDTTELSVVPAPQPAAIGTSKSDPDSDEEDAKDAKVHRDDSNVRAADLDMASRERSRSKGSKSSLASSALDYARASSKTNMGHKTRRSLRANSSHVLRLEDRTADGSTGGCDAAVGSRPEGDTGGVEQARSGESLEDVKQDNADETEEEEDTNLLEWPAEGSTWDKVVFVLSCPVYVVLVYTIPKPDPAPKWFMATFGLSLFWIGFFSFFLVWWVEILGGILVPGDTLILPVTVLAAGTSIPDAVSSMAVARDGFGDMAISSSIGSNIFDILVGLPIPWIIKIGIIEKNKRDVIIKSSFLTFYVLLLLCMVCCVVTFIHILGWKLNKMLGLSMSVLYVLFLVVFIGVQKCGNDCSALMF